MNREYKSGTEFSLSFDGKLTIDHLSSCWERDERGTIYTYACFSMTDEGEKARHEYDYSLLSHGVVWIQHLVNGGFGLRKNDGTEERYSTCDVVQETAGGGEGGVT